LLAFLTLLFLVPFSGDSFHADDPLFIWAGQHILHHPLDPYGFNVVWYAKAMPMSEVTKNPPLASYYLAGLGAISGWSEWSLHIGLLLPALSVVLGTYALASRMTNHPLLAAAATLLTPGFLVSSTTVMCDVSMLALWVLAAVLWVDGMENNKPLYLLISSFVVGLCALTKYFGMALIPLLLVYSVTKRHRLGGWIFYLVIPIAMLAGYQYWTHVLYGRGLLSDAATYAHTENFKHTASRLAKSFIGLSFVGGCTLSVLTFVPVLWSRWQTVAVFLLSGLVGVACARGVIPVLDPDLATRHGWWVSAELAVFVVGGISVLALAVADWWNRKYNEDSVLLLAWVVGTIVFATFMNWTVNARSVLPLIPAAGILLARRIDKLNIASRRRHVAVLLVPLVASGVFSLWVTCADARLANSARFAAQDVHEHASTSSQVMFQGHWGFQYYMQSFGFQPVDFSAQFVRDGLLMVIPENNTNVHAIGMDMIGARQTLEFNVNVGVASMSIPLGAGFYSDLWGPLPFAIGSTPPERYAVVRLVLH
jgi:hypothetical protein